MLQYLKDNTTYFEIDAEQSLEKVSENIYKVIEPIVIHVRSGSNNELRKEMLNQLTLEHGFINLEVNSLIRDETERRTEVG